MNTKRRYSLPCLAVGMLLAFQVTEANAFWWLLRGAGARTAAGAVVRGTLTEMEAATLSRQLAAGARFCIRPVRATACDFRTAASARDAVQTAVGSLYQVRETSSPNIFEILDAVGNVNQVEVLDREQYSGFEYLPAYFPPQEENEYEVACSAGFSPGAYNSHPNSFEDWSCSNGRTYYNAAPTCQPDRSGWRAWQVKGGRLGRVDLCEPGGDRQALPQPDGLQGQSELPSGIACGSAAMRMSCPSIAISGTDCRRCQ